MVPLSAQKKCGMVWFDLNKAEKEIEAPNEVALMEQEEQEQERDDGAGGMAIRMQKQKETKSKESEDKSVNEGNDQIREEAHEKQYADGFDERMVSPKCDEHIFRRNG